MVEVFKTTVEDISQSFIIVKELQRVYPDCAVNFDLDDCDKVLRIKSSGGPIQSNAVIDIIRELGFYAEVLEDHDSTMTLPTGNRRLCLR